MGVVMKMSILQAFVVGVAIATPTAVLAGLGDPADAAMGDGGTMTAGVAGTCTVTSWTLKTGHDGFEADGTCPGGTWTATSTGVTLAGSDYTAADVEVAFVFGGSLDCTIALGTVVFAPVTTGYMGSATVTSSDYTGTCGSRPTGTLTITLKKT